MAPAISSGARLAAVDERAALNESWQERDWRADFPSADAAAEIAAWFDAQITNVRIGRILQAIDELRAPWWMLKRDLDGIPPDVLVAWQVETSVAYSALRDRPPNVDVATHALKHALALYTEPH